MSHLRFFFNTVSSKCYPVILPHQLYTTVTNKERVMNTFNNLQNTNQEFIFIISQNILHWKGPQRPSHCNPPALDRNTFHQSRLLRGPSNLALHIPGMRHPDVLWETCSCASIVPLPKYFSICKICYKSIYLINLYRSL